MIIIVRCALSSLAALAVCAWNGIHPLGRQRRLLLTRGCVGCGGIIGLLYASTALPLAIVSLCAIGLQPIFAALAALALMREKPSRATAVAIPLCVLGIALVLAPSSRTSDAFPPLAIVAAVGSPCCIGSASAIVRMLSKAGGASKAENAQVVMLYLTSITLAVVLIWSAPLGASAFRCPGSAVPWAILCSLGGYGNQLLMTKALAKTKAASAATMGYLSVVWTTAVDLLVFGRAPTSWNVAGGLLVLVSTAFAALSKKL